MSLWKVALVAGVVTLVVMAVVSRVDALDTIVNG